MVEVGEFGGELCADFVALEGAARREDGNFGHHGAQVDGAELAFEVGGCFDVLVDFLFDQGDVGLQGFLAEAEFDELVRGGC